jgi:hypothetical protein
MSLINQILGQQVVPLTVGLAVLMLFTAIILAMVPRMKAARVRRAKVKAQRLAAEAERAAGHVTDDAEEDELAARARAKAQATGDEVAESGKTKKGGDKAPKAKKPGISGSAAPAAGEGKAPPAIGKPPIPTGQPASAPAAAKAEEKKDEPTPEMLDLLSSVFSEEESAERQAKLMKGMENVEIDHLMTLCNTVLGQIRGEAPSIVVKIKENQLQ